MIDTEPRYKIKVLVNGVNLTYSDCSLLEEKDNSFIKFSDKFNVIYKYNKNLVVSMEELKNGWTRNN